MLTNFVTNILVAAAPSDKAEAPRPAKRTRMSKEFAESHADPLSDVLEKDLNLVFVCNLLNADLQCGQLRHLCPTVSR